MTHDDLIIAMLHPDTAVALVARRIYRDRHQNDQQDVEPAHCPECFEGCSKCMPAGRER